MTLLSHTNSPPRARAIMLLSAALLALTSPTVVGEVVGFSNGQYDGYDHWNWDALTVLGFWTPPNATVRAEADKLRGIDSEYGKSSRSAWSPEEKS